jgi:glyceraldehyde 3-phosphate dehydrogenase
LRFPIGFEGKDWILANNRKIKFTKESKPENIPWDADLDLIFECTGSILTEPLLLKHLHANMKSTCRIVVSAPVEGILNVVIGCNDALVTSEMKVCTAASCTTNCAAPVVGVLDAAFGVDMGTIMTVHNVTPTQTLMDSINPGKNGDLRRARAGASNLSPTTTGSAKAIAMIYPNLKGKLNGLAIRVPLQNASITYLTLLLCRDVTAEEVNLALKQASNKIPTVLGFETKALVSTDFVNDPRSSIVDALSTLVVNKRLVKVLAWYDNEWGYANRMVDLAVLMSGKVNMMSCQKAKL